MSERGGAATFGDVTGEYFALRNEAAWTVPWHDLVWVRGPDTVRFLDGLVSQAVEPMTPGSVARSLLLAPQGKLRAPHVLLRGDDEVGLLCDAGSGATVVADLRRFKIRVDVSIEPEQRPVVDVVGPAASAAVAEITATGPVAAGWTESGVAVVAALPFGSGLPRLVVAGLDGDGFEAAGLRRAGRQAMDAVRIEAGEPLMGVDIDEATIPQEAGLVDGAVDFDKGCYLGQELVARIDSRGHVNRRLRGIRLTTNVVPPLGAEVRSGERVVGTLTSVAESLELRAPIGLAMLRREVEAGTKVDLHWAGGSAAAIAHELPFEGAA